MGRSEYAEIELKDLIADLPEVYQTIWKHSEFSISSSRNCEVRLGDIEAVFKALRTGLVRPIRVLDLGCAQGFFSLALAQLGAEVVGIDLEPKNIALCRFLAAEQPDLSVTFEVDQVESVINRLSPGEYDLVLGLSVFHHIIHAKGIPFASQLVARLSSKVMIGIFELAVRGEPMYWADRLPDSPSELLSDYAFVYELGHHGTHLSNTTRPMYYASNSHWYVGGRLQVFSRWTDVSNNLAPNVHLGRRRFFIGESQILKYIRLGSHDRDQKNLSEWYNEVALLSQFSSKLGLPRLHSYGRRSTEAWLVRDLIAGEMLDELLGKGLPLAQREQIIREVLAELVTFEKAGLYHDDVRTWNVIVTPEGRARLLDYGAISSIKEDCTWPKNLMLSFLLFMHSVISGSLESPTPTRQPSFNPDELAEPFRRASWKVLSVPSETWTFSQLSAWLDGVEDDEKPLRSIDLGNAILLIGVLEDAVRVTRSHLEIHRKQAESCLSEVEIHRGRVDALQVQADARSNEIHYLRGEAAARLDEVGRSRVEADICRASTLRLTDELRDAVLSVERLRSSAAGALRREEIAEARLADLEMQSQIAAELQASNNDKVSQAIESALAEAIDADAYADRAAEANNKLSEATVRYETDLDDLRRQLSELEMWRRSVIASSSWRVTRPFRVVGRALKRSVRGR